MLPDQNLFPKELLTPGEVKHYPKLYARDNTKAFKVWDVRVVVIVGGAEIIMEWGKFGGKMQIKPTRIMEGKNIGRANETTPLEQAYKEAEALWEHKRTREGYYSLDDLQLTKADIGYVAFDGTHHYELHKALEQLLPKAGSTVHSFTKPMLAHPYMKKTKDGMAPRLTLPFLGQPKLNGVRCLASYNGGDIELMSRDGVRYRVTHIELALSRWYEDNVHYQDIVFDGELYIHNTILADIVSAARKPNLLTPQIEFHAFDLVHFTWPQKERSLMLLRHCNISSMTGLKVVPTKAIASRHDADMFLYECINMGYEGAIFRDPVGMYESGKRSSYLVKYKKRESGEFMIMGIVDSQRDPGLAIVICRNDINHETFEVIPQGGDELRKRMYNDRHELVGKMFTVEYYERTAAPKSVPFHTVGIVVRDYE